MEGVTEGVEEVQIQTKIVKVSANPTNLGLGAVASGQKRWVTFLKITNVHAAANEIILGSGTTATDIISGTNAKDRQGFGNQYDAFAYPDSPRVDQPLFSIAGGKYLTARCSAGVAVLFVQYYDK